MYCSLQSLDIQIFFWLYYKKKRELLLKGKFWVFFVHLKWAKTFPDFFIRNKKECTCQISIHILWTWSCICSNKLTTWVMKASINVTTGLSLPCSSYPPGPRANVNNLTGDAMKIIILASTRNKAGRNCLNSATHTDAIFLFNNLVMEEQFQKLPLGFLRFGSYP